MNQSPDQSSVNSPMMLPENKDHLENFLADILRALIKFETKVPDITLMDADVILVTISDVLHRRAKERIKRKNDI